MNGADAPAAAALGVCEGCGHPSPCQCDGMGNSQGPTAEAQDAIDRKTAELRALEEQATAGAPQKAIAPSAGEAIIDAQVRAVLGIVIRGLMVSAPTIPVHTLFNSIARQTGHLMAGALSGDVEAVAKVRTGFRLAFVDGVQKVPIVKVSGPDPKRV